jgi:hypothetical protein
MQVMQAEEPENQQLLGPEKMMQVGPGVVAATFACTIRVERGEVFLIFRVLEVQPA